jgi:hypothetical protein
MNKASSIAVSTFFGILIAPGYAGNSTNVTSTIDLADYGIQIALPRRWKIKDLSQEAANRDKKTRRIFAAIDKKAEVNVEIFAGRQFKSAKFEY